MLFCSVARERQNSYTVWTFIEWLSIIGQTKSLRKFDRPRYAKIWRGIAFKREDFLQTEDIKYQGTLLNFKTAVQEYWRD